MNKKLLFLALALLTAMPSWCIEETWEDDIVQNDETLCEYIDPVTNVVYTYDPEGTTASVKAGHVDFHDVAGTQNLAGTDIEMEAEPEVPDPKPGSPDASNDITILERFTVDGKEYVVTSVGNGAFQENKHIKSVVLPETVTSIGEAAFSGCDSLTSVNIPSQVTVIRSKTFYGCKSMDTIDIPLSVKEIERSAFYQCQKLKSIDLPESLSKIGGYTFSGCTGLVDVKIPASVTEIGSRAFLGCSSLESVSLPDGLTQIDYEAFMLCRSLKSVHIPASVTSLKERMFVECDALESITVSEDNPVYDSRDACNAIIETATNRLLTGCNNATIPNGVVTIGDYAFERCQKLSRIDIPESVEQIGNRAFLECSSLEDIALPENLKKIGFYAFYSSGLTSITIPASVKEIGSDAFLSQKLTTIISFIERPSGTLGFGSGGYTFDMHDSVVLYVPKGCTTRYKAAKGWNFKDIREFEPSGIGNAPSVHENVLKQKGVMYDLQGRRVNSVAPRRGVVVKNGRKTL